MAERSKSALIFAVTVSVVSGLLVLALSGTIKLLWDALETSRNSGWQKLDTSVNSPFALNCIYRFQRKDASAKTNGMIYPNEVTPSELRTSVSVQSLYIVNYDDKNEVIEYEYVSTAAIEKVRYAIFLEKNCDS